MAQYNITAPDGTKYQITAPDDATQDQVMAYAQQQHQSYAGQGALSAAPASAATPQNAPDNGVISQIGDFFTAAGHHFMEPLHGAADDIEHGIKAGFDLLPNGNPVRDYWNGVVAQDDNAARVREAQYQATQPSSLSTDAGAIVGSVAPYLVGGVPKLLEGAGARVASLLPEATPAILKTAASGATQGAIASGVQPVTSGDFGSGKATQLEVGAGTGGLLPVAGAGIRNIYQLGQHVFAPGAVASNELGRILQATPETVGKLQNAPQFVPGEQPTTAQVIATPQAVAAEKALLNNPAYKAQYDQQANANNAARLNVLQNHAGDEQTLQAAIDARKAAAQPFIEQNLQSVQPATRFGAALKPINGYLLGGGRRSSADFDAMTQAAKIVNAVKTGKMQEDDGMEALAELSPTSKTANAALDAANTEINRNLVPVGNLLTAIKTAQNQSLGMNPYVKNALQSIAQQIESQTNTRGMMGADLLDAIRQNASRYLAQGAGPQERAGLVPITDKITDAIDGTIPGYRDYLASYARNSVPINTMETTQRILAPTDSAGLNSAGAPQLTLGRLNAGLRKADGQRYGLSPEAEADAQNVRQSLQRESISNSIRTPGSDTAYNLQAQGALARNLLGPTLGGPTARTRGVASVIGAGIGLHVGGPGGAVVGSGLGLGLNKAAQFLNQRIMDRYAQGLLNPQEGARMVQQFLKANKSSAPKLLAQYPQWKSLLLGMPQAMTPKPLPAQ